VDFLFNGHDVRGIEQNPSSNNRWAALVRSGKKVAQFISNGRYIASVVDGKLTRFSQTDGAESQGETSARFKLQTISDSIAVRVFTSHPIPSMLSI